MGKKSPRPLSFSLFLLSFGVLIFGLGTRLLAIQDNPKSPEDKSDTFDESTFLHGTRQLTLEGSRSGEGYFSRDGGAMVFQSEREPDNPFYQIYFMDRETGDVERVSPGYGKTTCAWIHPDGQHVLFASTQYDSEAKNKQVAELEIRASGKERRYAWDYDPTYDLVEWDRKTKSYRKLTDSEGYDAEASYSPDGEWIAFSSNRRAYQKDFPEKEKVLFDLDPASASDLYIMRRNGSDLRRLTDIPGYDGGPFFSPDGKRICWRRFAENGATAEIYTMTVDGSDPKRLTNVNAMSWAPFYHPSGDYLIFASNPLGFANFELYMVASEGGQPQRVTGKEGFDGLPVFTPDGKELVWTSNRTANKKSQLFIASWNDVAARKALGLEAGSVGKTPLASITIDREAATLNAKSTQIEFRAADVGKHIDYLCRPELGGRLTGTEGEIRATAYVASFMESMGLEPAGTKGDWFHPFAFTSGVKLGPKNRFSDGSNEYAVDKDWRPLVFSKTGEIPPADVVFAGYGLVAPKEGTQAEYDSYVHLDVEGKWVLVLRQLPSEIAPERRQHLARYSGLRYKAMAARDRGALGMIVVSGPTSGVRNQLVPLSLDGPLSGSSLAVLSVTDSIAQKWFEGTEEKLEELQKSLDKGEMMMGFKLPQAKVGCSIDIAQVRKEGRNVLGLLRAGDRPSENMIVVGAHIDHLGAGENGTSLAKEEERGGVHRGADDNASGVAGMLEVAQYLSGLKRQGKLPMKHDVLFAAWSGEELGLLGSISFADDFYKLYPNHQPKLSEPKVGADTNPHAQEGLQGLYPAIAAALNMDMIGRMRDNLVLQGIGSSGYWTPEIEKRNAVVGLPVVLQNDSYLPTDANTFYLKGVPILSAFTGSHSEYHTPRDTPDLINYEGAAKIANLMGLVARTLANSDKIPEYVTQKAPENQGQKAMLTAYLGSVPDYVQADIKGVLLSGVASAGPAAAAGVKAGDVIVELAGKKVENIYDYTYAIEALKVGQETDIVLLRKGETLRLKVIPTSRQ